MRRETVKRNEIAEHEAGGIRRKTQCYATDHAVKVKAVRAKANRATLERLEVVNEAGQACNLQDVADKSVSNPKIRRGELMVRARGFEETAKFMGHVAIFLTITCPSRFHRWAASGVQNPHWIGDTPRDAQDYLCGVWQKIRAAWGRRKIMPYGFRVAEPHHDACPHWHILLFMPQDQRGDAVTIAHKYAMQDSPKERGAMKHRFTCEDIDTSKGSATGYISKYISKNIDGLTESGDEVGLDFASGKKASDGAVRVKTWASTWSIRQFQQVGGPSVTVWRELRRLGAVAEGVDSHQRDLFDGPQNAADRAIWSLFWMLQGGPEVSRSELTLKPAYTSDDIGKYGEEVKKVAGVSAVQGEQEFFRRTRLHTWTIQPAGAADANAAQAEHRANMESAAKVQRFLTSVVRASNGVGEACPAWTGVNNCTDVAKFEGFDFSGFEPGEGMPASLPEYSRRGDSALVAEEVVWAEKVLATYEAKFQGDFECVKVVQKAMPWSLNSWRESYEGIRGRPARSLRKVLS